MVVGGVRIQGVQERPDGKAKEGRHHDVEGHIIQTDVHCGGERLFFINTHSHFKAFFWIVLLDVFKPEHAK